MLDNRLPKLIAFDLDYTLWDLWIDTHISPPIKRKGEEINKLVDRHGQTLEFYRDVPQILHRLRAAGVVVAACSRTATPALAKQALTLLLLPPAKGDTSQSTPEKAIDLFDQLEIYPGTKIPHFKKLHEKTSIPYSEMLFFDDEHRNREVESLGVTFHLVPTGVDNPVFEKGLKEWRKRHPQAEQVE